MSRTQYRKRPLTIGVMVLIALVALWLYILWSAQSTLDRDAKTIIEAALNNDPDTVYLYAFDFQKETMGVSKDRFAQMWRTLIQPRMKGVTRVGEISAHVFRGDHQAEGWTNVKLPSGATFELSVAPWATGERGGCHLLHFLIIAWDIEYVHAKGHPLTPEASLKARLQGIGKDRPVLESLGFMGWPPEEPGGRVVSWDETIRFWEKRLVEIAQTAQRSPNLD